MQAKKIGIIGGKGKMGKYFAAFFEKNGYEVLVSDKGTKLNNEKLANQADVVIVSVPIEKTRAVIAEIAPKLKSSQLLMDLTSLKEFPVEAMMESKASVIGLHPLFGPTNAIAGQKVVACFPRAGKWKPWLKKLFTDNKVELIEMTAKKHDKLMAYVQVLSHFTDVALGDTLKKSNISIDEFLNYQSPVYRLKLDLMGRVLNQSPELYSAIQIHNKHSNKVLRDYLRTCKELAFTVKFQNYAAFERIFKESADYLGDFTQEAMDETTGIIDLVYTPKAPMISDEDADLAVLGPKNTYSHLAAKKYKPKAKIRYCATIAEVFELVEKGKVSEGLVPYENSLSGSVRETLDELFDRKVWIQGMFKQPIKLALVAPKKFKSKDIEVVYSHAQPLMQTADYLKKHLSKAAKVPVASTVAALEQVKYSRKGKSAAIASAQAAEAYDLTVIKNGIEDDSSNATRFAVIVKATKKKVSRTANKTSIGFSFSKDSPGNLNVILQEFAEAGVNLTKIESRPGQKKGGEYRFFVDFDGNAEKKTIKKILQSIKKKVSEMKLMGCYKAA